MIRLLSVEDSALMRRLLDQIFEAEGDFEIQFARDGVEALALLHEFKPDVVTLDVQMPQMDGLTCLDRIMVERPCPVVMFSSLTEAGAEATLQALALGAVDFVTKPGGAISLKLDEFAPRLVEAVRGALKARVAATHRLAERIRLKSGGAPAPRGSSIRKARPKRVAALKRKKGGWASGRQLVLVGSSTGGPPALDAILGPLPMDFPWPIVVAQHMPASFTGPLAARLDRRCRLSVREVVQPTALAAGCVYIARGEADIIVSVRGGVLMAMPAPASSEYRWHPSVDRMVESALQHVNPAGLVGVLMTGMGNDGAAAMTRVRAGGGRTVAEAEETAVVWGMPGELVRAGGAEFVDPVDQIGARLVDLASRP